MMLRLANFPAEAEMRAVVDVDMIESCKVTFRREDGNGNRQ